MDFRPTGIEEVETKYARELKARQAEHYFRGPVRMSDIRLASQLSTSCLALLMAIHHRVAVTKRAEVTLPTDFLCDWGIGRTMKSRGLEMLEKARLITVERKRGNSTRVKLVRSRFASI